ncbi:hypothetical protein SDC9_135916 [bioreactor metagenome]|uniref:NAD-specific glutamate dehydrogenase n=1 Tax=bioreactor metagenome TaxID=1076179 RepID=A0A645DJQ8_9ZZZZ
MEDGVVGRGAAQLDDFGGHVHAAGGRHDLDGHRQAQALGLGFALFNRVAAKLGVGIDEGHLGTRLFLGNVLEQDAEHLGVVGADQELVRVLLRVVQFGGKRGTGHEDVAVALQLGVDGFGKTRGVAVVQIHLVLAGNLLERGHRHIDLVARVFRHVLHLAAFDATGVVDDLHVVLDTGVDAHAREGEHARHGNGAANDDLLGALRQHRQRVREGGGTGSDGSAAHEVATWLRDVWLVVLLVHACLLGLVM